MRPLNDNPFAAEASTITQASAPVSRSHRRLWVSLLLCCWLVWEVKDVARVQDIEIYGHAKVPPHELLAALNIERGDALYSFSPRAAQTRVESIPLVERAHLQRMSHGVVRLMITERVPAIAHVRANGFAILDREGHLLHHVAHLEGYDLPVFKGDYSPAEAMALWRLTLNHSLAGHKVTLYHYVAGGRWDVYVDGVMRVMLSEHDVAGSWRAFLRTENLKRHLRKKPPVIDAREPHHVLFTMRARVQGAS